METATLKQRLKALLIDYLYIIGYLIVLALIFIGIYYFIFEGIPEFTESQSHWIAFLTTIAPVTLYFTIREGAPPYASIGKVKMGLKIEYSKNPLISSFIRNALKFLPWHLGHYSVIRGMYTQEFLRTDVLLPYLAAILLPIIYILMVAFRKKHQHLPDILAQAYIVNTK